MSKELISSAEMPVLALRDVVVYPHMVIPLFVGREKSIRCLDAAMANDKQIFLVAQKDAGVDEPEQDDIYNVGTIAITQITGRYRKGACGRKSARPSCRSEHD